jgi:hypothetical protein
VLGREDRDRREHRARAGDENETEAGAEQESAAEVAAAAPRQKREGPLEQLSEPGPEQRRREHEQQRDRDVPQEILRKPERGKDRGCSEREDGEAGDEAGDDRVRPPAAAARSAGEQDRQHRQHAR